MHNLLVDLDFPTIYTTNYDHWLEAIYEARKRPYRKIVSITDLAHPRDDRTEIIKFHGDFDAEEQMVLTETSYFQRMAFEAPLDIRLRADSLARPVLFLGYSLQDVNIRYLLFRLQEDLEQLRACEQVPVLLHPDDGGAVGTRDRATQPERRAVGLSGRESRPGNSVFSDDIAGDGAARGAENKIA